MISLKIHNKEEKWMEGYDSLAAQIKKRFSCTKRGRRVRGQPGMAGHGRMGGRKKD